jgi:hypothetical protein
MPLLHRPNNQTGPGESDLVPGAVKQLKSDEGDWWMWAPYGVTQWRPTQSLASWPE